MALPVPYIWSKTPLNLTFQIFSVFTADDSFSWNIELKPNVTHVQLPKISTGINQVLSKNNLSLSLEGIIGTINNYERYTIYSNTWIP